MQSLGQSVWDSQDKLVNHYGNSQELTDADFLPAMFAELRLVRLEPVVDLNVDVQK